jgi:hypothetical protein
MALVPMGYGGISGGVGLRVPCVNGRNPLQSSAECKACTPQLISSNQPAGYSYMYACAC